MFILDDVCSYRVVSTVRHEVTYSTLNLLLNLLFLYEVFVQLDADMASRESHCAAVVYF
jgi:hypothetical protein